MRCPVCDWPHGAEEPEGWEPDGGVIVAVDGSRTAFCLNCAALITARLNELLFERGASMELAASRKLSVELRGDVLDQLDLS